MKVWTGRATIAQTATGRAEKTTGWIGLCNVKNKRARPRHLGPCRALIGSVFGGSWEGRGKGIVSLHRSAHVTINLMSLGNVYWRVHITYCICKIIHYDICFLKCVFHCGWLLFTNTFYMLVYYQFFSLWFGCRAGLQAHLAILVCHLLHSVKRKPECFMLFKVSDFFYSDSYKDTAMIRARFA